MARSKGVETEITEPTNGGRSAVEIQEPYVVHMRIVGTSDLLFHRWNAEAVEEKAKAKKGSKAKKTDDIESYVYRNEYGDICLPTEYIRQAIIHSAKFMQDPRSPRKSAMDLFKAGVVMVNNLSTLGKATWDYEDRRRVQVQRAGINRTRPAMKAGWTVDVQMQIILPEYITQDLLHQAVVNAGRLIGVGDFRPTFGRFAVVGWQVL